MKNTIKLFLSSAIGAYIIKFLVDIVMYIFMKNEQSELYHDFWYLFVPQIISSGMMVVFYMMFFSRKFFGLFFMISTAVYGFDIF